MIPYGRHCVDDADIEAVAAVLRGGALTQGPKVDEFERAIAARVGARHAVAVSSATAGLHIAALAAGMAPGRTLVTSPITFVASANAALYCGGRAAFADIDGSTLNMSPDSLETTVRRHGGAQVVIPVHFGGLPCDMPAIKAVADRGGAHVIEDAAHAVGATYPDGTAVGCCRHSLCTVFSFHPVKNMAMGEGGVITTNDSAFHRRLLRLRSHGINKADDPPEDPAAAATDGFANPWYYEMQELGFHYRVTDIQCALGLSQLRKLDRFLARRRELAAAYDLAFAGFRNLRPAQPEGRSRSGLHLYVVRIDFASSGTSRARLMTQLRARGIGTQVHYIPVNRQPLYRKLGMAGDPAPEADRYYSEALSIPLYFGLSDAEQSSVVGALRELVG
jgi:perosamine synthetase